MYQLENRKVGYTQTLLISYITELEIKPTGRPVLLREQLDSLAEYCGCYKPVVCSAMHNLQEVFGTTYILERW